MDAISMFSALTLALAALFFGIGLTHLAGPRFLRDAYEHWNYSPRFRLITGLLEIDTAAMLVNPALCVWGIALAAVILFVAVVTLLSHDQYLHAVPGMAMMAALIPAAFAAPPVDDHRIHYAASIQSSGEPQHTQQASEVE